MPRTSGSQTPLAPHLDQEGVLFDIGANIGYFTKVLGERTGFRGAVHLFEPIPHLARMSPAHACRRAVYAVSVHQFGLSDSDGRDRHLRRQAGKPGVEHGDPGVGETTQSAR